MLKASNQFWQVGNYEYNILRTVVIGSRPVNIMSTRQHCKLCNIISTH